MNYIKKLDDKLINQIVDYQNNIQDDIQEVKDNTQNLELKLRKDQERLDKPDILESKLSIFYKKKIMKLENILTKIF